MDAIATKKVIESGCGLPQPQASALWAAYEGAVAEVGAKVNLIYTLDRKVATMTLEHGQTLALQRDLKIATAQLEETITRRTVIATQQQHAQIEELQSQIGELRWSQSAYEQTIAIEKSRYETSLRSAYNAIRTLREALSNYLEDSGFLRTLRRDRIARQTMNELESTVPSWEFGFQENGDQQNREADGYTVARKRRSTRNPSGKQGWVRRWFDRS